MMRCLIFILAFLSSLPLFAADSGLTLTPLARPTRPGDIHAFIAHYTAEETLSLSASNKKNTQTQSQMVQSDISGTLHVLRVNAAGNASKIRFTPDTFVYAVELHCFASPLAGKTITVDLGRMDVRFARDDGGVIDKNSLAFLQRIFTPASNETAHDLFGPDSAILQGSWEGPKHALLRAFSDNRIPAGEKNLASRCSAKKIVRDGEVFTHLSLQCKTVNLTDLQFLLELNILLPEDPDAPEFLTERHTRYTTQEKVDLSASGIALPEDAVYNRTTDERIRIQLRPVKHKGEKK